MATSTWSPSPLACAQASQAWSDISLDLVTDLPPSKGNITILTIVDRFSKMVQFVPMSKLPSAKEIAEAVLYNVDRLHGFPRDIVSDRGPQFVARFWRDFCKLVVAFTSLNPTARQRG